MRANVNRSWRGWGEKSAIFDRSLVGEYFCKNEWDDPFQQREREQRSVGQEFACAWEFLIRELHYLLPLFRLETFFNIFITITFLSLPYGNS